jgi:hypothetical protein
MTNLEYGVDDVAEVLLTSMKKGIPSMGLFGEEFKGW